MDELLADLFGVHTLTRILPERIHWLISLAFVAFLFHPSTSQAGAWTLPKGRLWIKSAFFYQATSEQFCSGNLAFCSRHQRAPFDPFIGGRSKSLAVFTEASYGLTGWLDLGVQIPYFNLEFRDISNPSRPRTSKFGDVRFYARYRLFTDPVVASIRLGVKSPTGGVNVDSEVVPIGEGQWDLEFYGDVGRSFTSFSGYANLSLGYRVRRRNDRFDFKPGDEASLLLEGGWTVIPRLMVKGTLHYLYSGHPRSLGFTFMSQRRELLTASPVLLYKPVADLTLEALIRLPLRGQGFPAGPQFGFGLSYSMNLAGNINP